MYRKYLELLEVTKKGIKNRPNANYYKDYFVY